MPPKSKTRSRAAERKAMGCTQIAVEISDQSIALLGEIKAALAEQLGRCSNRQAIEFALREGIRKIRKKSENGLALS